MDRSLLDPAGSDRRRWTFLSAVTFGVGALGCAMLIWGGVLALLWDGPGPWTFPGEDLFVVGLVVAWALGTPVLGGVAIGTPLWYLLVERLGVENLSDTSKWWYPLLGAAAGIGAGVLSHLVVWGSAGLAGGIVWADPEVFGLGLFAAVYSILLFGSVTGVVGAAAGAILGYLRHRGTLWGPSGDPGRPGPACLPTRSRSTPAYSFRPAPTALSPSGSWPSISSWPPMYGRRASGTVIVPSSFW